MPLRRKTYRKKRAFPKRGKRTYRKRTTRTRISRNPNISRGVHSFKRVVNLQYETTASGGLGTLDNLSTAISGGSYSFEGGKLILTSPAAAPGITHYYSFGYMFDIANLPNLSEFTGLFDSYKIRKVVVKFIPFNNVAVTQTSTMTNFAPIMHYYIDHDDHSPSAASEAGINEMHQRNNYKTCRMFGTKTIVIKPRATNTIAGGASATASEVSRNTWLDCGSTGIHHYGLKFLLEGAASTATASNWSCRVETTYYLAFKGVR